MLGRSHPFPWTALRSRRRSSCLPGSDSGCKLMLQRCFHLSLFLSAAAMGSAAEVDYLRDVKPILTKHCYACHGAWKQNAGLQLDTGAAIRKGGESGPAV